ncbi:MAG TPA: two-component regulator propeller domain-containing protein [Bacteroidia bacterium]|nr:two-component regulator propeller domain-containing protein [Bacteroidia bacterium]
MVCNTYGQQYFFKNYSVESGLPFIQVACMYQDGNGYLWSGGYGGLSRFDGKTFKNYTKKDGLPDINVNAIEGDDEGRIYAGTGRGLCILEGNLMTTYQKAEGLSSPAITALCKGYHHSIYIGTEDGLYIFSKNQIRAVRKLQGYRINCIYKSDTSALYIGTDKGLVIYGHQVFEVLNEANGLTSNRVNCIEHFRGNLVIGTAKGLSFYNLQTRKFANYHTEHGLIDENISSLENQNDQVLWVGSHSGLMRFDNFQFNYYNVDVSNNSNHIKVILRDKEDNIWLGTYSGLFRYRDNSFSTFDKASGPGNSFIFRIFRDRTGDLWVCTQNDGLFRYAQNYFRNYTERDGVTGNTSRFGCVAQNGDLLFGTDDGLLLFRNDKFQTVALPPRFKGPVDVIQCSSGNRIWLGGSNGIVALNWDPDNPGSKFYPIPSKTDFAVYGFCEDKKSNLYIGTYHAGLYMLSGDSMIHLNQRYHLDENNLFTLRCVDDKIFAATLNGLLVFDTKSHQSERITVDDGLNSDLVYSTELAEGNQSLWIGTNQGINKLNLKQYLASGKVEIERFGKQEGFAGVECNTGGIWEDNDGTLWFGTVNGLIRHQPSQYRKNNVPCQVLIQSIQLNNQDTALAENASLPNSLNNISFYYRGICLTNPDKVRYMKKLTGLETEWSHESPEDYSKYANLAPGKYVFRVKACNNEGIWSDQEASFAFEVQRPFYSTWWFLALLVLLLACTVYFILWFRIYTVKREQKKEFERKVEMSKIELKALRSQMNPHFIFNSLNSIQHYILNSKSDEAIKYLSKFARLIRLILNNSDKPTVTVGEDLETLKLYMELEKMRFEDKFEYEIVVDNSVDLDYDIMPPMLMQPYVENAILHGLNPKPEKGKLLIHIRSENNFLICTITDNGIGRERSSEIKHIMPVKSHRPVGMKITEERLKILNEINASKLSVIVTDLRNENSEAAGTRVELFIPLNG